jgi:uncharacterized protein YcnI
MRKHLAAAMAAAGALALPATAGAHVSLHPNTLPAGSNPTIAIRVPNEQDKADTTKVDVQFPPGFIDVPTLYMPGWKVQVVKRKLATPVKTDQGTVSEEVAQIIWSGGRIPPGTFLDFPITTAIPDDGAGKTLTLKTLQTYSNGDVVRWIGPPSADQPAPTVNVTPKGGVIEDVAGTEAGPPAQSSSPSSKPAAAKTKSSDSASKGLGITALIVGILGLLAAIVAIVLAGRRSRGKSTA